MRKGSRILNATFSAVGGMAVGAGLCAAVTMGATGAAASDAMLRVEVDEAEVFPLAEPPATVIVGNPLIADASVHHGNLLVIQGKNYGTTNIIVLDHDSREIANLSLNVVTSGEHEVSLFRGSARISLNCAPFCETELNVGDNADHFIVIQDQIAKKSGLTGNAISTGGADGE